MRKIPSSIRIRETLPDGRILHLRAIRPADRETLRDEFLKLSKATVRDRFFSLKSDLTAEELTYFTEVDFTYHVALVAELELESGRRAVGVGRFVRDRDHPEHSEFAITITDEFQGRGIGKLLLKHLVRLARGLGVTYLDASVLPQNARMSKLLHHSGLPVTSSMHDGILTYSLAI